MKINNHLNDEINSMKEDKTKLIENENKLKLKINDMDIQIRKLKEDSMKKEKALNAINNKLDKIYENLLCPISLSIFEEPVICPSGITYEKKELYAWIKKQKVDPLSKKAITEEQLYPNNVLKNVIEAFKYNK